MNKTFKDKLVTLRPENFNGSIVIVGSKALSIPKGADATGELFIYQRESDVHKRKTELSIGLYEGSQKIQSVKVSFVGPFKAD